MSSGASKILNAPCSKYNKYRSGTVSFTSVLASSFSSLIELQSKSKYQHASRPPVMVLHQSCYHYNALNCRIRPCLNPLGHAQNIKPDPSRHYRLSIIRLTYYAEICSHMASASQRNVDLGEERFGQVSRN